MDNIPAVGVVCLRRVIIINYSMGHPGLNSACLFTILKVICHIIESGYMLKHSMVVKIHMGLEMLISCSLHCALAQFYSLIYSLDICLCNSQLNLLFLKICNN